MSMLSTFITMKLEIPVLNAVSVIITECSDYLNAMLSIIMLNYIMLSVVAPKNDQYS
jgi:hypothetical protein